MKADGAQEMQDARFRRPPDVSSYNLRRYRLRLLQGPMTPSIIQHQHRAMGGQCGQRGQWTIDAGNGKCGRAGPGQLKKGAGCVGAVGRRCAVRARRPAIDDRLAWQSTTIGPRRRQEYAERKYRYVYVYVVCRMSYVVCHMSYAATVASCC
jgi:hypothetical protein